jgi:hypothetical protein
LPGSLTSNSLIKESVMKTSHLVSSLLIAVTLTLSLFNPSVAVQAATGCASSTPSSGNYTVTICITSPSDGSNLTGNATVTATASVVGATVGVQRMIFNLGSSYLLTDYSNPYTFTLPSAKWADGSYTLYASALMRDGFTTRQASIGVRFSNGNATNPVNTNQFTPSSGRASSGGQPFVVAATGDGASGETNSSNVVNLLTSVNPNLFLYLGDVYESGSMAEFYNWYGTSASNFGQLRAITDPTIGNHEYGNNIKGAGYFDYWNNIPNYYSFNAGGWHFISLNSNSSKIGVNAGSAQYNWLQQDLSANTQTCTIVYYHQPLFNIGPEGATTAMADIWALLAQYNNVPIVLNGHDHDYQRWVPLNGSGQVSPNGITEFVVGSAGHGLQAFSGSDSRVAYSNDSNPAAFGALILTLSQASASFVYHAASGSILDSGVIPCGIGGSATATPTNSPTPTFTPTASPVGTPTSTATPTFTNTPVATVASTATFTSTPSATNTPVPSATPIATNTPSATPTATLVPTNTRTATPTVTSIPTNTPLATPTATSIATNTPTPTFTPVSTPTPTAAVNSLTFIPVADTYVDSSNPTTNYGSKTTLRADGSPDVHSYLRFTVTGVSGTITRVRLLIYANSSLSQGLKAEAVADNTWGELTATYNNAPALGSVLATSASFATGTWMTFDVTASGYISGNGTYSFGVSDPSSTAVSLASREAGANAPQLIIDFQ